MLAFSGGRVTFCVLVTGDVVPRQLSALRALLVEEEEPRPANQRRAAQGGASGAGRYL